MNKIHLRKGSEMASVVPARGGGVRDWQRWAPYAAVAWSLIYAALGVYWAVSGRGFPYTPETVSDGMGPLLGRFGPGVAWIVVMMAGIPAAAMGTAMLRGVRGRALRPLFITAGALLAGVLLLLMTGLNLLVTARLYPLCRLQPPHWRRDRPGYPGGLGLNGRRSTNCCVLSAGSSGWRLPSATPAGAGTPACIAAAETARKGGQSPTKPRAGAGSPCMWRWWRQSSTPSPVTPGRWGSRWG